MPQKSTQNIFSDSADKQTVVKILLLLNYSVDNNTCNLGSCYVHNYISMFPILPGSVVALAR